MDSRTSPVTRGDIPACATDVEPATPTPPGRAERSPSGSRIARGLSLLRVFREGETELMLKQLTNRAGLATGTAHRLSRELVELGVLDRTSGGFRPGPAIAHLVLRATTWPALTIAVGPAAENLHGLSGCPVSLYVPSGAGLLPMWRLTSHLGVSEYQPVPPVAEDLSPYLPALGRRTVVEGVAEGQTVLLSAIRGENGEPAAVLCITGDGGRVRRFAPALTAAATEIGRILRHTAEPAVLRRASEWPVPARSVDASVLARGINLLTCLRPGERSVRRTDVVDRAATPRSTAYRCLGELLRSGVLDEPRKGVIGPGHIVRRLAGTAVAPCLPTDDRLRRLAALGDASCWLTPVDPDLGIPLNGVVVRARTGAAGTVRSRFLEWALVSASVTDVFNDCASRRVLPRTTTPVGGLHAVAVPVRHAGVTSCLTVITHGARRPLVERLLRDLADRQALSA